MRLTGPPRWALTTVVCLLVVLATFLELNLLGVTDFPFETPRSRSPRDERLTRVLRSAKSQCRFGNALVSAGATSGQGRGRVQPESFARTYANSFAGTTEEERRQIRAACLRGLTDNGPAR
jgi:hypothetical protein